MSDVIDFTAKKGRKVFRDWQTKQAEEAQNLPEQDTPNHYIEYLRGLDAGELGPLADAADCLEELLGNLHEAEQELENVHAEVGDLRAELAEMEVAMGELEFESTTWRHELGEKDGQEI